MTTTIAINAWRLDSETFRAMQRVCHMVGLRALTEDAARQAERDGKRDDRWRTAVHETGHLLAFLVSGVSVVAAELYPGGGGRVHSVSRADWLPPVGIRTRIAVEVAGAVLESCFFDRVDAAGAHEDLRVALAKVGIVRPDQLREDHEGIPIVRGIVDHVRETFLREPAAAVALAEALRERGRLGRGRAIGIVTRAGMKVDSMPRFQFFPSGSTLVEDSRERERDAKVRQELREFEESRRIVREDARPKQRADAAWEAVSRAVPDRRRRP